MNAAAKKFHYTNHFAPEHNGKGKCTVESAFRCKRNARESRIYAYVGNPKCFAARPDASGKSDSRRNSGSLRGINKLVRMKLRCVPDVDAMEHIGGRVHTPQIAKIPAHAFADCLYDFSGRFAEMPYLGQRAGDRILHREACIGLVPLFLRGLAPRDILHHPFVVENFAADFVAHYARVFGNPDHASIPPKNFRFKIDHLSLFAHKLDEFSPASGLNIKLA